MSGANPGRSTLVETSITVVREVVDGELAAFLAERRAELASMDPAAVELVDEVGRLLAAGGKRIRPALCLWAHRAAGGEGGPPIVGAAAALELLHTFALIHDDVMDASPERRGVASTHVRFAADAPSGADAERYGVSVAILVGDLAAALAERRLRTCGAPAERLSLTLERFDRVRERMAAGQLLDLRGDPWGDRPGSAGEGAARVARLKTGSYTAEGPVLIGTALAGARPAVEAALGGFARLLGEAFQLRDDVLDGDAPEEATARVDELIERARAALHDVELEHEGRVALDALAGGLCLGNGEAGP